MWKDVSDRTRIYCNYKNDSNMLFNHDILIINVVGDNVVVD